MRQGWWRRNTWGLLLVLPLTAGLMAFSAKEAYDDNYRFLPKEPVAVDGTGRAVLDDIAMRVIEVKPLETDAERQRVTPFGRSRLPSNVKIWRAILTVEGPPDGLYNVCEISLVDEIERTYGMAPAELSGDSSPFKGCSADDEDQPMPYTTTSYYVLPAEARPTAVIISWADRLPRFIELAIP